MITNKTGGLLIQTMLYLTNQQMNDSDIYNNELYQTNSQKPDLNEVRCYGIYGCFKISPPWTSESRPVSLFPESIDKKYISLARSVAGRLPTGSASKVNPRYPMFTGRNPEIPTMLDLNDPDVIQNSKINPTLPIFFIAHGFLEAGDRPWIGHLKSQLLSLLPCTVIVVDWRGGSGPPYSQAVANIRLVASMTAHLIAGIAELLPDKNIEHIHIIGHSLGAHLAGYVGYTLQNEFGLMLGRISGLDPAEPHFANTMPKVRLDKSAARYVSVIHTDASGFIKGGLGILESIGHVDYYPNNGRDQPGCGNGMREYIAAESGSFFRGIRRFLGCNHIRSYQYFIESISSSCPFLTISCSSYENFIKGECFDCHNHICIKFGYHGMSTYKKLVYNGTITTYKSLNTYSLTGAEQPFCRAHYRVTVTLSNSTDAALHGGEVGLLWLIVHGTHGSTERIALADEPAYHEPGIQHRLVVPGADVGAPVSGTLEWEFRTSVFNPLTWRLMTSPRIYVEQLQIDSLEYQKSVTICPQETMEFITNQPRVLHPLYCSKVT